MGDGKTKLQCQLKWDTTFGVSHSTTTSEWTEEERRKLTDMCLARAPWEVVCRRMNRAFVDCQEQLLSLLPNSESLRAVQGFYAVDADATHEDAISDLPAAIGTGYESSAVASWTDDRVRAAALKHNQCASVLACFQYRSDSPASGGASAVYQRLSLELHIRVRGRWHEQAAVPQQVGPPGARGGLHHRGVV